MEPGWFPLIARAAWPQALLSFRYIGGPCFRGVSPRNDWEWLGTKSWPVGPRPTLPRWYVRLLVVDEVSDTELAKRFRAGDIRALARAISLVERRDPSV